MFLYFTGANEEFFEGVGATVANVSPGVAAILGIPAGFLFVQAKTTQLAPPGGPGMESPVVSQEVDAVAFDPNLYNGVDAILLRVVFDDTNDLFRTEFSLDGGVSFLTPFDPFTSGLGATAGHFQLGALVTSDLVTPLEIDIKPGSFPNPIKLTSRGVIPVAILSTEAFDATTVDPASVCFGDAEDASERDCSEAHGRGHIQDVDGDADLDLVLHFERRETGIGSGDTEACLTGEISSSQLIEGCDSVRTIP